MTKPLLFRYIEKPLLYIEKQLNIRTWSGMRYIIDAVWNNKRTSVRAAHGVSKTFTAAVIAVTFLNLFRNSIVITTAPTERQVRDLLWKEIGGLYDSMSMLRGTYTTSPLRVKIKPDWYMVGFSTEKQHNIEGYHAPHLLWILDEAKGLPQWVYDAVEGSLTGGTAKVLEISTTDGADQQTPFAKHHTKERTQWKTIHFSGFDSPFVNADNFKHLNPKTCQELKKYGKSFNKQEWPDELKSKIQITDEDWIKDKEITWLKTRKDLWDTKVCGELSDITMHNIIPLSWVESAINAEVTVMETVGTYGVDVGAGGDPSVVIKRLDKKVLFVYAWVDNDTMSTTGEIIRLRNDTGIVKIDMIGVGHGPYNRLAELGVPVIGVDSRNKPSPEFELEFINLRAQMWWHLRDLFMKQYQHGNTISIPDDEEMIEELTTVAYKTASNGKIKVEDKEEVKKRLGRSTNKADALVYCFADLSYWLEN